MTRQEQRELLGAALSGQLASGDAERLLAECRRDRELLEELGQLTLIERLLSYAHLYGEEDGGLFVREVIERLRTRRPAGSETRARWWKPVWPGALAASLMVLASVAAALLLPSRLGANAFVVRTEAVAVDPGQPLPLAGRELSGRRLQLRSGLVELRFKSGASLILQGPADFEVAGPLHCILHRGKLLAEVPKTARGFTVDGPRGRLIDLGTEFGVDVSPSGDTEVHVLQGRVEAIPKGQRTPVELTENHALRLTAQTNWNLPADATAFVTDMPPGATGPIGFVHWSFDESSGAVACNSGRGLAETNAAAHLLSFEHRTAGPQWIPGQFGSGISLNGEGDYVECDFPGIGGNQPRTVAFWVKVPRDFRLDQSDAVINWGTDARQGALWRVSVNNAPEATYWGGPLGRLRVGVHGGYVVGTTDLRDGRWHHCAVVMYGGRRPKTGSHVLIYIDGQLEPAARNKVFEISTDVQHATAHNVWIGRNLSYREAGQKVLGGARFFRGCVDEVFIFNAALPQEQILSLMKCNQLESPLMHQPAT